MDKEILTSDHMKRELRSCVVYYAIGAAICSVLFVVLLFVIINAGPNSLLWVWLLLWLQAILLGALLAYLIKQAIDLIRTILSDPVVVIDKRIATPVGEREYVYRRKQPDLYILYFRNYGKVSLPSRIAWECTFPGDQFYLLLDRNEKILAAYPCNEFEYSGTLTPNKYEK